MIGFHDFKKQSHVATFPDDFSMYIKSFGDIYFWEKGKFHVVTRVEHAKEVLNSSSFSADRGSFFISRMPNMNLNLVSDFFGVVKKMMVMSDDEDHARKRKSMASGFEDQVLLKFEESIRETIKNLVSAIKGQKEFEFVETVAKKLPSTVLANLFSIPEEDRADFLNWSNIMTGFFGGASQYRDEDGREVNEAALNLKRYFSQLIDERMNHPQDDYVSHVLKMQSGFDLGRDDLISQLIMMLVAGMATTTDQINNSMFLLALHQDIQEEVRTDLSLIPQMLEEFKRYDPAVTFIFRVAKEKTRVGGQIIKAGDVIFISTHLVNRDLPLETRPYELDIHRKARHLAYGYGAHYCIGAKLARLEMSFLFESLIQELPPFKLSDSIASVRDHYSLSFSGFKELHLMLK